MNTSGIIGYRDYLVRRDGDADLLNRKLASREEFFADLEAVPDFTPAAHMGHKMQAKGYLVRQPNAERISLSSMEMLDSKCAL